MYCDYYGFSEEPFEITPDPSFIYMSPGHEEVLTSIIYGIQGRRGIIAVVGEVGTGKTILLNTALEWLSEKTKVAYVINFDVSFDDLLRMVLVKLGLATPEQTLPKIEVLQRLNEFALKQLSDGGNVALIVDEAQNLSQRAMENLRLLSNMETAKHKLIQIVLSGQPELEKKLARPELRQLTERISIRRYINPLKEKETYEYIQHRLDVAQYNEPTLFEPEAQQLIWQISQGIPRKINILCDNALFIGFRQRHEKIGSPLIKKAVSDLRWLPPQKVKDCKIEASPPLK
jgi:general secretion pathway protein A